MTTTTTTTEKPDDFSGAADLDRTETWLRRPITGSSPHRPLPEKFIGWTYLLLSQDEEGRLFLAKHAYDGDAYDPFARRVLALLPHAAACACDACKFVAAAIAKAAKAEAKATKKAAAGPPSTDFPLDEDPPQQAATSAPAPTSSSATPATPATGRTAEGEATDPPPAAPAPDRKVKLKKASAKPPVAVAEGVANLEAARVAAEIERPLERIFAEAIAEEDDEFIREAKDASAPHVADESRAANRETIIEALVKRVVLDNAYAASWAARRVLAARENKEKAALVAKAINDRAERDLEYAERVLLKKMAAYVESIPVDQRASEKSARFPNWPGRITLNDEPEHFEVVNEHVALASVKKVVGEDAAIAKGLSRVETKLSVGGFKEYLNDNRAEAAKFGGIKLVPKSTSVSIHRK